MDYLSRAAKWGQDIDAIKRGTVVTSEIIVNSIDEYRDLFADGLTDQHRAEYELHRPKRPVVEPMMDLLMAYVFGQQEKTPEVERFAALLFPLPTLVTSGTSVTISTDRVIGPGAPSYGLNAGTLIFDGGSLTINSTVSAIVADNLVLVANPTKLSKNSYHVGIVGNKGAVGGPAGSVPGIPGTAEPGGAGGPPIWGTCTSGGIGGTGHPGATGTPGRHGNHGGAGTPSFQSTITIKAFDASNTAEFVLATWSGGGGDGSKGGTGGKGQTGGPGGAGCCSGCEGSDGGTGGPGGRGGQGGTGGNGGDGVEGYPIAVNFPNAVSQMLAVESTTEDGGNGGSRGDGGPGGDGGAGGKKGKHHSDGKLGGRGPTGLPGGEGVPSSIAATPGNVSKNFT